jgi:hypothetical protein
VQDVISFIEGHNFPPALEVLIKTLELWREPVPQVTEHGEDVFQFEKMQSLGHS